MYRLGSKVNTSSPEFKENKAYYLEKLAEFRERLATLKKGGPPEAVEKHMKRGKLPARKRLELLFDRNTPFLEFNAFAANGLYKDEAPCAGVITGVGIVNGKEVLVVANDATVKGGTYFPLTGLNCSL